jgi:hypothetical protein
MTRLRVALLLGLAVLAVLAGCGSGAGEPPPSSPVPTPSPVTTLLSTAPRAAGTVDGYQRFDVTAQQYDIIGRHVHQVIVREKLWDQGVRFGAGVDQGQHFVLIKPGFSGLSARQILNRLLGTP